MGRAGGEAEGPGRRWTPCSPPQKAIFQDQNHKPSTINHQLMAAQPRRRAKRGGGFQLYLIMCQSIQKIFQSSSYASP